MFRGNLLRQLGAFDDRFFYHFEESDLCYRIWQAGHSVLYYPNAEIIHLGGQSVGRFPIRFALETFRSGYRFFYKHYGLKGAIRIRRVFLLNLGIRYGGYRLLGLLRPTEALAKRLQMYQVALYWNYHIDPIQFIESGKEPQSDYEPLAPAPRMIEPAPSRSEGQPVLS
jgi:GT2 family glycosyltransferase